MNFQASRVAPRPLVTDFDEVINRRGSGCAKWDGMSKRFGPVAQDAIPMWVADMDLRPPAAVQGVIQSLADHGLYGYSYDPGGLEQAAIDWMRQRHNWMPDPEAAIVTHGILSGISVSLQAFSDVGDTVIVFSPVYHVYEALVADNQRSLLRSPLVLENGRYRMDLQALGKQLTGKERVVLMCSPHNPGGTVWSRQELNALAQFCAEHDLILVSDEIHHDLVYAGNTHCVLPIAAQDHLDRIVVLASPTKTFNIAGAMTGLAFIEDVHLRKRFQQINKWVTTSENGIGRAMSKAAYSSGADWLSDLMTYLKGNRDRFEQEMALIPGVRVMNLQATYLAWVDFSGTGRSPNDIRETCYRVAGVVANEGVTFGKESAGWMRFNLAMPRIRIDEAISRLRLAFQG